ncbi:MAG: 4Fe-4S dicluster domain-containing protein [Candidatus Hodarchaeales archaeon]|jgi:succinate dehydrogenase/fumarate reductase-like Fe-S protein
MAESELQMISVYIMGKEYKVPIGLTIMEAFEYSGYRFTRGSGCRAGFCGACGTIYRKIGDYRLYVALACQTAVEEGMYLAQLPFTPANRAPYEIEKLEPSDNVLVTLYPEVARCVSCNTCSKACPQDLEVMDYVQAALRGDIEEVARLSFDCVQCGICTMRCPSEIPQYHVGQLARRLYGKYIAKRHPTLEARVKEIKSGKYDEKYDEIVNMSLEKLKELYVAQAKK